VAVLPTFIAWRKKALELTPIFLINLFLGLTVFGCLSHSRGTAVEMREAVEAALPHPTVYRFSPFIFPRDSDWRSLRDQQRCRGFHLFHSGGRNMQASRTSWSRSGSLERKAHPRIWPKTAAK
jgi:hypothetical protein